MERLGAKAVSGRDEARCERAARDGEVPRELVEAPTQCSHPDTCDGASG